MLWRIFDVFPGGPLCLCDLTSSGMRFPAEVPQVYRREKYPSGRSKKVSKTVSRLFSSRRKTICLSEGAIDFRKGKSAFAPGRKHRSDRSTDAKKRSATFYAN